MKKVLQLLLVITGITVIGGSIAYTPAASAQLFENSKEDACEALNLTNGAPVAGQGENACGTTNDQRVENIIRLVLNVLSLIVGVAAVIMIVMAGLKFVLSGGDSSNIASARTTLFYAIIGLIVAITAQAIVRFVLKRTTHPAPSEDKTIQSLSDDEDETQESNNGGRN